MIDSYREKREEDYELINSLIVKAAFKIEYAHRMKRLDANKLIDKKKKIVEGNAMSEEEHQEYMDKLNKRFNKK